MNKKFELNEMELDMVAGGRPRIHLGKGRGNGSIIKDIIKLIKKIVKPEDTKPQKDTKPAQEKAA
ncbi:hypothetical protein [Anaerovibrio sp. RM50]|uniref:hypothetical protein n=1 Tax=Anaerovibrio sp. RM50 TaxID=1200557 RepID=UPI0004874C7B|nr:hypothetical protein [Anaerovibrio sp. RM50]